MTYPGMGNILQLRGPVGWSLKRASDLTGALGNSVKYNNFTAPAIEPESAKMKNLVGGYYKRCNFQGILQTLKHMVWVVSAVMWTQCHIRMHGSKPGLGCLQTIRLVTLVTTPRPEKSSAPPLQLQESTCDTMVALALASCSTALLGRAG